MLEDLDECSILADEDFPKGLGSALDSFKDYDSILALISDLNKQDKDVFNEVLLENFCSLITQYTEQPHLLDSHLEDMITKLLEIIHNTELNSNKFYQAFELLHWIIKVRGYKVVLRHLPHKVFDVEPVLGLMEAQNASERQRTSAHSVLLLWLAVLSTVPIELSRFDSGEKTPIGERIMAIIRKYLPVETGAQAMAAYMGGTFLSRPDIRAIYLDDFFKWVQAEVSVKQKLKETVSLCTGMLATLVRLLKVAEKMNVHADMLMSLVTHDHIIHSDSLLLRKFAMKVLQRVGLTYLPVNLANWRYVSQAKKLASNLAPDGSIPLTEAAFPEICSSEHDNITVPSAIEDILELLLTGLEDPDSTVRWSAAKGIGRITSRLPQAFAAEVVKSLLSKFESHDNEGAWHGSCLALAEIGRRGVLSPLHLREVVDQALLPALIYDERRAACSVGGIVRDAACYVCWTLGRSFQPSEVEPVVKQVAAHLLVVAVYDRQVNCRRAAAAAFQECVGRLGSFPRGIEIMGIVDYFSVGLIANSYLNVSVKLAELEEYTEYLIKHLLEKKVGYWDRNVRELSAQTLRKLTPFAPQFMAKEGMESLLKNLDSIDDNWRKGSLLAIGEIVVALSEASGGSLADVIGEEQLTKIAELVDFYDKRRRRCIADSMPAPFCTMLSFLCEARFPAKSATLEKWIDISEKYVGNQVVEIRHAAAKSLAAVLTVYTDSVDCGAIVEKQLKLLSHEETSLRAGAAAFLGNLSSAIIQRDPKRFLDSLTHCTEIDLAAHAEARAEAVTALSKVAVALDLHPDLASFAEQILHSFVKCLDDYSKDSRGDLGFTVRRATMVAVKVLLVHWASSGQGNIIPRQHLSELLQRVVQQSGESNRNGRKTAADTLYAILHCQPPVPDIPHGQELRKILPGDGTHDVQWIHMSEVFPVLQQIMALPTYTTRLLMGLIMSAGGLSDKDSIYALTGILNYVQQLQEHPNEINQICEILMEIGRDQAFMKRGFLAFLRCMDRLFTSGILAHVPNSFLLNLLRLIWQQVAKSAVPQKLLAAVDLFCNMMQFDAPIRREGLQKLMVLLMRPYPVVRNMVATKLYETLLLYSDAVEDDGAYKEVLQILCETDWLDSQQNFSDKRDRLCQLLNLPLPTALPAAKKPKIP